LAWLKEKLGHTRVWEGKGGRKEKKDKIITHHATRKELLDQLNFPQKYRGGGRKTLTPSRQGGKRKKKNPDDSASTMISTRRGKKKNTIVMIKRYRLAE